MRGCLQGCLLYTPLSAPFTHSPWSASLLFSTRPHSFSNKILPNLLECYSFQVCCWFMQDCCCYYFKNKPSSWGWETRVILLPSWLNSVAHQQLPKCQFKKQKHFPRVARPDHHACVDCFKSVAAVSKIKKLSVAGGRELAHWQRDWSWLWHMGGQALCFVWKAFCCYACLCPWGCNRTKWRISSIWKCPLLPFPVLPCLTP